MAAVDVIGSADGGVIHIWPAAQSESIAERLVIAPERSEIKLSLDQDFLHPLPIELRASLIAHELEDHFAGELGTHGVRLATLSAREIVSRFPWNSGKREEDHTKKWLVDYFGEPSKVVPALQELSWLRFALDSGATPADLEAWGVHRFTIAQLIWWQRRPGETRLSQHIRAIRNGWGLRYLDETVRDQYRNLFKFIDDAPPQWLERFSVDLDEIREVQDFFAEDAQTLSKERQAEWAAAFLEAGLTKIAPDATGRYAYFLPASFKLGILRKPLEPIARYLETIDVTPSTWADFDQSWFGRS
jgi:hypothetical protein